MSTNATRPTMSEFTRSANQGVGATPGTSATQFKRTGVKTQRSLRGAVRKTANGVPIPSIPQGQAKP